MTAFPPSNIAFKATRALIRSIVEDTLNGNRPGHLWSVQGFGMLRTYLDEAKVWRLNLWHSAMAVPDVSTIHDHPWDFTSLVVAGTFTNIRYRRTFDSDPGGLDYQHMRIKTGEGGGPAGYAETTRLVDYPAEVYRAGMIYRQHAEEVHESRYADGTITINERVRRPDPDHANVFWRTGNWVDAEPRQATLHEIRLALVDALVVIDAE